MKKITTVDEFLERRVAPEQQEIVAALRRLMSKYAPDAHEVVTYGILAWKRERILAVVSPTKKDVTFAFSRGAEFTDAHGLLQGVGKVSKHVKLKRAADVKNPALRDFIKQAVALEQSHE